MISLYGLFILLLTAETIHAQGDTNDGDAVDQVSGSKDATSLPLGTTPTTLPTTLQESNTPDQSDASSSADLQPGNECKGGHGIREISKSCPQQQSPPGSQPSTLYDSPQPDEMPLPVRVSVLEVESYSEIWKTDQYIAFTKEETKYFESEYLFERELVRSEEPSVARCMSSRPPNPLIPYEFMLQKYLSRPGHENPYVPMALDHYILKDAFILVMEYVDENWVSLSRYADEKGKLDIETARDIVKEVINGMIYLKQYGIVHNDLNAGNVMYSPKTGQVKLIDFGMSDILPGWEEGKSVPLKSPDSSSTILGYKARDDERWSILVLRKLLYRIITPKDIELVHSNDEQAIRETIPYESDPYKRGLKKKAIRLIVTLNSPDPEQIPSTEAILNDPFFN
ncbi:hypothetical protein BASA83_001590 [Batrachochytrium salamandrivorans]|nr:hypothetical protein BASA62_006492 [Batrachochytrium salamandrivorans]KAH9275788.1 hypothetical protein BASA83_001590 [Batrachochytrium salamandrivorans]